MNDRDIERILSLLNEDTNEEIVGGEEEDDENSVSYESDHNTESEQDGDLVGNEDEEDDIPLSQLLSANVFRARKKLRDGTMELIYQWNKTPPTARVRTRQHNIVSQQPGPVGAAQSVSNPRTSWNLFITESMINSIVECTNIKIRKEKDHFDRDRDCSETNINEVRALIGLLYIIGTHKSSHANFEEIWKSDGTGVDICRAVMPAQRLRFLLRVLRFDNIDTRQNRKEVDNLAPIRELFDSFVANCQNNFSLSEYTTIDEMLEPYRGPCPFRQFTSNKPQGKYGIKVFALVDARTFYVSNLEVYAGQQPEGPYKVDNSTKALVKRLVRPISGTGRNVMLDNWFTSIPLGEELLREDMLRYSGLRE